MLRVGVSTNNECGKSDEEILNNIKNAGFENVMVSFKNKSVEETITLAKSLGISVEYLHLDNRRANELWATGESAEKFVKNTIEQIELCGRHNIKIAVMHSISGGPTDFALPPNKQGLENMQRILEVAKKNNVKIAIENIARSSTKHLFYILDNIKSENLGFCYDVGHHHLYNPNTDLIKKYEDRVFALHLHDNLMDWKLGYDYTRDIHLLPFDGKINFDRVCKKLHDIKYKGIVMLELHKNPGYGPEKYKEMDCLEYLKEAKKRGERLASLIEKES